MTKKKDPSHFKRPDYRYRVQHLVPEHDPKDPRKVLRDAHGNIRYKIKYGNYENGFLNRDIDCYDAYLEDHYIGTVHVKMGSTKIEVKNRFLTLQPFFPKRRVDEVEFRLTCQIWHE